jgi:malate dehydrogenase (oxaloacetate-decarboxylating)(NADP+)
LGRIYPSLAKIRKVSANIAVAVAQLAYDNGLATENDPANLLEHVKSMMFEPNYKP